MVTDPRVAEITALELVPTALLVMVNFPSFAPAGTVTEAGTSAKVESDESETTVPAEGAGLLRVTVALMIVPPITEVGAIPKRMRTGALMPSAAVLLTDPRDAVNLAVESVATGVVVIVKLAVVDPPAMETESGTPAKAESDARDTLSPATGAIPVIVTVPVTGVPPWTLASDNLKEPSAAAVTFSFAVLLTAPTVAVKVATLAADTPFVVTTKVAVLAPAATTTEAGTEAKAESEARETASPPAGAIVLSVTVPMDETPPRTVVGERASDTR